MSPSPRTKRSSLAITLLLTGCNTVSGFSIVNDTSSALTVTADLSSSARVALSHDCHDEGQPEASPVSLGLAPGDRACLLGPGGETGQYRLTDRVRSLVVVRSGRACLQLTGDELAARAVYDGRNAATQVALHVTESLCPSTP